MWKQVDGYSSRKEQAKSRTETYYFLSRVFLAQHELKFTLTCRNKVWSSVLKIFMPRQTDRIACSFELAIKLMLPRWVFAEFINERSWILWNLNNFVNIELSLHQLRIALVAMTHQHCIVMTCARRTLTVAKWLLPEAAKLWSPLTLDTVAELLSSILLKDFRLSRHKEF